MPGYVPPHLRNAGGGGGDSGGGGGRSLAALADAPTPRGGGGYGGDRGGGDRGGYGGDRGGGYSDRGGGGGGYSDRGPAPPPRDLSGFMGGGDSGGGYGGGGGDRGGYGGGGGFSDRGGKGGGRGGFGGGEKWIGVDGGDQFDANLPNDEQAFRREFGEPHSSGIDFAKYADIPVEVELPPSLTELPEQQQPVKLFPELNVGKVLSRNLRFAGFQVPTPVQGYSVPMAIGGQDVISVAQTGSGKTLAFMLPIMYKLLAAGPGGGNYGGGRNTVVAIRALALAPTRELAIQIQEESKKFAFRTGLRICVAYGGAPFGDQMRGEPSRPGQSSFLRGSSPRPPPACTPLL